jgi:hypothetical protein
MLVVSAASKPSDDELVVLIAVLREENLALKANLVRLVLALGNVVTPTQQNVGDLRNYAKLVKLSLIALVDGTKVPSQESESMPRINRMPGDGVLWHPNPVPPGWDIEEGLDPDDPQYRDLP